MCFAVERKTGVNTWIILHFVVSKEASHVVRIEQGLVVVCVDVLENCDLVKREY